MRHTILAVTLMTATLFSGAALAELPAAPVASDRAVVVAVNEGNVEPGMVASLVQLLTQGFNAKGISTLSSAELVSPVVLDDKLGAKAQAAGAGRIFVLHILRLNEKTLLQVEERSLDGRSIYLTTLVPGDVESSNEILPRLADAVLRRVPATENADVSNVTHEEGGTHHRSHFVLAVPGGVVAGSGAGGIEVGYQFEASQLALGFSGKMLLGSSSGLALTDVHGQYYFLAGDMSPYAGIGMAFGGTWNNTVANEGGLGALAELQVGFEAMRFSHTHLDLGAEVILPLYSMAIYEPVVLGTIGVAF